MDDFSKMAGGMNFMDLAMGLDNSINRLFQTIESLTVEKQQLKARIDELLKENTQLRREIELLKGKDKDEPL